MARGEVRSDMVAGPSSGENDVDDVNTIRHPELVEGSPGSAAPVEHGAAA